MKKDEIIKLFNEGFKPREIADKVNSFEATVYRVISDYKKDRRLKEFENIVKNSNKQ
jgi:DNA invertase Pin-like site-specific DNA recombinase